MCFNISVSSCESERLITCIEGLKLEDQEKQKLQVSNYVRDVYNLLSFFFIIQGAWGDNEFNFLASKKCGNV